ncbi:MAG: SAM-dependent methyltransferase, partial [Acidobacteriota bacterium]
CLVLKEESLNTWTPSQSFDLITCVHGLHYIGDKLQVITNAVSWLTKEGLFKANLDPNNLKFENNKPAGGAVISKMRKAKMGYDSKHHIISCEGNKTMEFQLGYLGADDKAGPNYTGQPAVDSYYRLVSVS